MAKKIYFLIVLFIMFMILNPLKARSYWQKESGALYDSNFKSLAVDPDKKDTIYVGTSRALYQSDDRGKTYNVLLQIQGEDKGVNDVYVSRQPSKVLYAATDFGLYKIEESPARVRQIYTSSGKNLSKCFSVLKSGTTLYLGTEKGLLYKEDGQSNWKRIEGDARQSPIYHIIDGEDRAIYFSTGHEVFRLNPFKQTYRKIFTIGLADQNREDGYAFDEYSDISIKAIQWHDFSSRIFIAAQQGIYFSENKGEKWNPVPVNGVDLDSVTSLLVDQYNRMLVGTKRGAFLRMNGQWVSVHKGMETTRILDLEIDKGKSVWALTDQGVFFMPFEGMPPLKQTAENTVINYDQVIKHFSHEPGIQDVFYYAIDYAEVHPNKIKEWRLLARKKAWFPSINMGFDGGADTSFSDTIYGTSSSGGGHYIAPDDKSSGRDFDWDISFDWDLGDLIWSTDQTTIDSRSKLMVDLRSDILSQAARLYFERRRMQVELMNLSAYDQTRMDKEMRIAELTAFIDAITGGAFSRGIR